MKFSQILYFLFISNWSISQDNLSILSNKLNLFISEIDNEVWISSTEQGINRYLGNHTKHFLLNDSISGLEGSILQSKFFQDSAGNIWTSTYEYICTYINGKFNCKQLLEKSVNNSGYKIIAIKNDIIYLRINDYLYSYSIEDKELTKFGQTKGNSFNYTKGEILGAPWFNGIGFEIWENDNEEWIKSEITFEDCKEEINDILVKSILVTNEKEKYLITNKGLVHYVDNHACYSALFYYKSDAIDLVAGIEIEDNIILTTESQGVLVFSLEKQTFVHQLLSNSGQLRLIANDPYELFYSKSEKSIWISYTVNGVQKLKWEDIKRDILGKYEKHSFINRININNNYIIYSNNENEYSLLNHNGEVMFDKKSIYLSDDRIIKILPFYDQIIFLGNQEIVTLDIENYTLKSKHHYFSDAYNDITFYNDSIFILSGFNIYGSKSDDLEFHSIFSEQHSGEVQRFGPFTSSTKSFIVGSTNVWIKEEYWDTLLNIKAYANRLTLDTLNSNFYCATNSGLHQIDSNYQVTQLAVDPWQIGNRSITDIKHHQGYVYMVIEKRIARYNPDTKKLIYFTKDHFEHSPVFAIQDSVIHIAEKYVMSYDLNEAFTDTNEYILKLDELKINREALNLYETDVSSGLDLDHTQNEIAFTHYTNNWHNADLSSLRYKLLPHYPEWTMIKNGEEVEFPFLPPDEYTYMIQGILPSGEMTEVTTFPFEVNPPWWKTNWFYALSGTGIISILYSLYRYRLNQLTESLRIDNEMSQLEKSALQAQMNPHFIFNCLNSIQGFIMDNDKEQAMEYLGKFAKLIRLNLNASVDSFIRLDQEILILENYLALEQLRHDHSFTYHIRSTPEVTIDSIDIPPMLIQPFVENAVLHGMKDKSTDGKIEIKFAIKKKMLVVDIKDNGAGPSIAKKTRMHRSLGMSITKKRLEHINQSESNQYAIEQVPSKEGSHHRVRIKI